jgi:hypothetical protein
MQTYSDVVAHSLFSQSNRRASLTAFFARSSEQVPESPTKSRTSSAISANVSAIIVDDNYFIFPTVGSGLSEKTVAFFAPRLGLFPIPLLIVPRVDAPPVISFGSVPFNIVLVFFGLWFRPSGWLSIGVALLTLCCCQ